MISRAVKNYAAAIFSIAIFLFGAALSISAAVSFDSASSGAAFSNTGVTSLTWQHTISTGGTNKALFVSVSTTADPLLPGLPICTVTPLFCTSPPLPVSNSGRVISVTYNGDAMQSIGFQISADLKQSVEMFRLIAPDSGAAYNVVVTLNPTSVFQAVGGSTSFTGVSQTTPNGAFTSAFGTNNEPTISVSDAVVGDFVLDALAVPPGAGNAVVAGALQTERYNGRSFFNNSYDLGAGSTEPGATGAETMSWTTTNSSNWALAAISVKQSLATAANVSVEGRVINRSGKGIGGARVTITDSTGETRTATANFFGYFHFQDVAAGETYVFSVNAKLHSFSSQAVSISEDLNNLILVAD